jgi:citronellol/citronellal dehydrogenase
VALVTGGGTGIGAATARELAFLGATVVIGSRKPEHVEPAAASLAAETGAVVEPILLDIRDKDVVRSAVASVVARHGRIDMLVNNAGGQFMAPAATIKGRGFDSVVQNNLVGTWNVTRAVADASMLERGGAIVNVTMVTHVFPGMAHSVASRAGVEAMSRTLAVEWAAANIRIANVAPGYVASSGIRHYPDGIGMMRHLQTLVPMKRLATPAEIALAIVFLLGPGGAYVTGQTLVVDGGKSLYGDLLHIPDTVPMPDVVLHRDPWEAD